MSGHSKLWLCAGGCAAGLVAVPCIIQFLCRKKKRSDGCDVQCFKDYEFGGPVGAYGTMAGLPAVILFLYSGCRKDFLVPGIDLRCIASISLPNLENLLSKRAASIIIGWFGFQVALERFLPGKVVEGVDLAPVGGEGKLKYTMNGHSAFWASMLAAAALGSKRLAILYDEFLALAGGSVVFSLGLSAYLYATSFKPGALLASGGNSGNAIYDFFIGRELNPRIGSFDLKQFCELRPGLIGWTMLNLAMASKQYQNTGAVSGSMLFVLLSQGVYVWDALYQEQAILTTMDITTDGFGYMLAFGDLAWVPFTYGLQARYLVDHDPKLTSGTLAAISALGLGGYAVFRIANSQKDLFRRGDPSMKHLRTMEATNHKTGKRSELLISGMWGAARKINYTGDWVLGLSWSLATGSPFSSSGTVLTYFYPIYFLVLLIHRAFRDDHFCSEKYGDAWNQYKKHVPYLFVPYLL